MSWKRRVFENFKLYAVTDIQTESADELKKIEAAYRGGADIVQLRSKSVSDGALYRLGLKIRKIADRHQKLFFVNDRPDLALLTGADGVHLGQDDLPVQVARALFAGRNELWIGKSTHELAQAKAAVAEGADYIGVGPVFQTPTKPGYKPAGLEYVSQISAFVKIPFVAIGGIDASNLDEVLKAGARRIAVVRAIFGKEKADEASKELREKIERYSLNA